MTKRPLAFAASRDDWKFRVYTLLDAAFEHALKVAVGKANGYWRDARAVIADHLGKRPADVNAPDDWDKWKIEGVFWVRMEAAIKDGIAGRFPE